MFDNETPQDIMDWKIEDVGALVKDPEWYNGPSVRVRLNLIKSIYEVEGLTLTPDAALALASFNTSMLILATAGSGKTTAVQLKAMLMKLILPSKFRPGHKMMGKEILCLVYNKHNVADIRDKHQTLINRLKAASVHHLDIDDEVHACTMHSFCEFWRKNFVAKLNLVGFTLLSESEAMGMMDRSVHLGLKVLKMKDDGEISGKNMLSFYNLCKETMKLPEELTETDKFRDLGTTIDVINEVFNRYETAKRIKKKYDYCDMLLKVYELLVNNPKDLKRVQSYYSVIIADEVQDFTPIMWKLLKLFTNNGTPLVCIGDEDQNIYRFKGADIHELLDFPNQFIDGHVYTLNQNRRCRKAILDEAIDVISENKLRFDKKLIGTKDGGEVEFVPYSSVEGQAISVLETIKKIPSDEWYDTAICFREQDCSRLLIELFEENKIPYCSLQGTLPFSHEYYRHVFDVLNALELPYDREQSINLYKVLPCSRNKIYEVMGYDPLKHRFTQQDGRKHFGQYDYGSLTETKGFVDVMAKLIDLTKKIPKEPMKNYVGEIFELLDKYFWHYKKEQNCDDNDEIFEKRAQKFFSSDLTYSRFYDSYSNRLSVCRRNNESLTGVTFSTFHGLKGLEFKHVYAVYLDDDIFPNFGLIESRGYSPDVTQELKESETRLWYVAITRAIDDLHVYYSEGNPSRYVAASLSRRKERAGRVGAAARVSTEARSGTEVIDAFSDDDFSGDFEGFDDFDDFAQEPEPEPAPVVAEPVPAPEPESEPEVSLDKIDVTEKVLTKNSDYLSNIIDSFM